MKTARFFVACLMSCSVLTDASASGRVDVKVTEAERLGNEIRLAYQQATELQHKIEVQKALGYAMIVVPIPILLLKFFRVVPTFTNGRYRFKFLRPRTPPRANEYSVFDQGVVPAAGISIFASAVPRAQAESFELELVQVRARLESLLQSLTDLNAKP